MAFLKPIPENLPLDLREAKVDKSEPATTDTGRPADTPPDSSVTIKKAE
jgi:hypothetical protein